MNVSTTFCFVLFSACGLHTADNGSWKGKKKRRTLAYPRTIVGHLCDVLQNSRLHSAAALLQKKRGPKKRGGETMERRMRIAYTHTHTRTQEESRNKREREPKYRSASFSLCQPRNSLLSGWGSKRRADENVRNEEEGHRLKKKSCHLQSLPNGDLYISL